MQRLTALSLTVLCIVHLWVSLLSSTFLSPATAIQSVSRNKLAEKFHSATSILVPSPSDWLTHTNWQQWAILVRLYRSPSWLLSLQRWWRWLLFPPPVCSFVHPFVCPSSSSCWPKMQLINNARVIVWAHPRPHQLFTTLSLLYPHTPL